MIIKKRLFQLFSLYNEKKKDNQVDFGKLFDFHPFKSSQALFYGWMIKRKLNRLKTGVQKDNIADNKITPEEIKKLTEAVAPMLPFLFKDLKILSDIETPEQKKQLIQDFNDIIDQFFNNKGLSSGNTFRNWMNESLRDKIVDNELSKIKNIDSLDLAEIKLKLQNDYARVTYAQLNELIKNESNLPYNKRYYKHLYIAEASRVENQPGSRTISYSTSEEMHRKANDETQYAPHAVIAYSVRNSMSIPGVFIDTANGFQYNNELILGQAIGQDAGLLDNYPIRLFDTEKYLTIPDPTSSPHEKVKNHETLGFNLVDRKQESVNNWLNENLSVVNRSNRYDDITLPEKKDFYVPKYLTSLGVNDPDEIPRHIQVDNCAVSLISFNLSPDRITELKNSGESAIKLFYTDTQNRLKILQQKADDNNRLEFNQRYKIYSEFCNLNEFSPSQFYTETKYDLQLNKEPKGINTDVCGVSGTGKSDLVYYNAQQFSVNLFWSLWRAEQLTQDSKGHIWIFDAPLSSLRSN